MRILTTTLQQVERVAFSPDGARLFASGLHSDRLAFGEPDTGIDVWDLAGGSDPVARLVEHRTVRWFAPLPDGRVVVAYHTSAVAPDELNRAVLSVIGNGETELQYRFEWAVWWPCAVATDGTRALAEQIGLPKGLSHPGHQRVEHALGFWTLGDRPQCSHRVRLGAGRALRRVAISADGRAVWTCEWVVTSGAPHAHLEFVPRDGGTGEPTGPPVPYPNDKIGDFAFGPGALAVAHDGASLLVFDTASPEQKPRALTNPARKHFGGFGFHPSGAWLAGAGLDGAVTLFDATAGTASKSWNWNAGQMRSVAFSPDGTLAAAGTDNGRVVVWDVDV